MNFSFKLQKHAQIKWAIEKKGGEISRNSIKFPEIKGIKWNLQ